MKKQYKSSRIKNHKITRKKKLFSLKVTFRFSTRNIKKYIYILWEYPVTNDA